MDGYAQVKNFKEGKEPEVTFNLSPTFEGQLKSAFRTFKKDSDRSLLIEDIIEPDKETKLVTWQFITQANIEITDSGAILKQDGQKLKLVNISHPGLKFDVISLDPPPHRLDKKIENLKRIELRIHISQFSNNVPFNIKIRLTEDK